MAARAFALAWLSPRPGALKRALVAGGTWGIAFGIGLTALTAWQCGTICLNDVVTTTALSVAAGTLSMGPLAAFA